MIRFPPTFLIITLLLACYSGFSGYNIFQDPQTKFYGIKKDGLIKIPATFEKIYPVTPSPFSPLIKKPSLPVQTTVLLTVLKDGRWQRINKEGEVLFYPMNYDNGPDYYIQGLSRFVTKENKVGFHNMEGKIIIDAKYNFAASFEEQAHAKEPKGTNYIQVCIECYVKNPADEKLYPVSSYADNRKKIINPKKVSNYLPIEGGKWGIIDRTGKIIVPIEHSSYEEAIDSLTKRKKQIDYLNN